MLRRVTSPGSRVGVGKSHRVLVVDQIDLSEIPFTDLLS